MPKSFDFFYDIGSPYSYLASTQLAGIEQRTGSRWAAQYGVSMQIPKSFPVSTIQALRAAIAADREEKGERAMHALFRAYWADGDDVSDASVIEKALTTAGLDGKALVEATQKQEIKDILRKNTDLALSRGVFGVPTLFVGERSFWGNDRLH